LGLSLAPGNYGDIIRLGMEVKRAVMATTPMRHPFENDLNFLYGTIFIEKSSTPGIHSRNVCIFAGGEVDRSATGSGVSGRAAIHFAKNEIRKGERIRIESITGSQMSVEVRQVVDFGPYKAVVPRVCGDAWVCGYNEFVLDPQELFPEGFFLR